MTGPLLSDLCNWTRNQKPTGGFLTSLITEYLGYFKGAQWHKLAKPLVYHCKRTNRIITVTEEFVCDLASFKRLGWLALLLAVLMALCLQIIFGFSGLWVFLIIVGGYAVAWTIWGKRAHRAAVLHDWLYRTGLVGRVTADLIFLDAMKSTGYWFHVRWPMFSVVLLLGWTAYKPAPGCMDYRFCEHGRNPEMCSGCEYSMKSNEVSL